MNLQRSGRQAQHRAADPRWRGSVRWSPALVNVVGLMVVVLAMGGSSRPDVWSLPILRPVAILSLFYGAWSLSREDIARHGFLFGTAAAVVVLTIASLVPLPPFVWTALSGREIIVEIDAAAGLSGVWRPISMVPDLTWNALFALAVPLAILTNGVRLTAAEHRTVMLVVLGGGVATMVLALLQMVGGSGATFYLYRQSSFGEPSGLFANRNHEALFLAAMLPLLAYVLVTGYRRAGVSRATRFLVFAGLLVTVAFIVVLGSRAGLVAGLLGLASFIVIATRSGDPHRRRTASRARLLIGGGAAIAVMTVVAWATISGSARSIERLLENDNRGELRYVIWPVIRQALPEFMPMGTGIGTYERVFRMLEPDSSLRPTYSNHAHNDWLEIVLTAGVPGVLLMMVAVVGFIVACGRVRLLPAGSARAASWMGLVIVFMAAIGSIIDYPLRTPILSALFALSCVWLASSLRSTWYENRAGEGGSEERMRT